MDPSTKPDDQTASDTRRAQVDLKRRKRLEREERSIREAAEAHERVRQSVSTTFLAFGSFCLLAGLWFLLVSPSEGEFDGRAIANLHRLTIGETACIAGAIFVAAGALLKYR